MSNVLSTLQRVSYQHQGSTLTDLEFPSIMQDPSASRPTAPAAFNRVELDGEVLEGAAEVTLPYFWNVGKVVWQSGFLLADYLIRCPPFRDWGGVRVVDLGTGTGRLMSQLGSILFPKSIIIEAIMFAGKQGKALISIGWSDRVVCD